MGSKTRLSSYCTKRANNGVNLVTSRKINTRLARPISVIRLTRITLLCVLTDAAVRVIKALDEVVADFCHQIREAEERISLSMLCKKQKYNPDGATMPKIMADTMTCKIKDPLLEKIGNSMPDKNGNTIPGSTSRSFISNCILYSQMERKSV